MTAVRSQYLLDLLAQVPDPRKRRGRRHPLAGLLAVGIAAVIAGSRSFTAIGQWAADAGPEIPAVPGAVRGPAEESTFRRAFALVSADVLDQVPGAWLWTRAGRSSGRLVIAVDGKTVRGAKDKAGKAPHLVAALAHGIGAVLGQVAVDEKSNEIPAVRELVRAFADLAGAVLTIDAMHTQHDTAQVIPGRGADYVMTVKANMPTLYRQLKELPWAAIPAVSSVSTGHGRRARRTIKAALAPAWIGFDGAAQVAQLRRTVTVNGKKTIEVVYLITSDRGADPATLAWKIRALADIARALAITDPDRATRVIVDAERIAQSLTDEDSKAEALADIARALAATDPDRAERIAQSLTDEDSKAWALIDIAGALAATDPDRAERIARSISREFQKVQALVAIVEA